MAVATYCYYQKGAQKHTHYNCTIPLKSGKTMMKQVKLHKNSRFLPLRENKIWTFQIYSQFKTYDT